MSSHLSRADLLKTLSANAERKHLYSALAEALGYQGRDEPQSVESQAVGQGIGVEHNSGEDAEPGSGDVLYLPKREQRYWMVDQCQPRDPQPLDASDWPEIETETEIPPQPLPDHPLRSAGQWQNLWDSALSGRRRGRAVDLKRSLRLLERSEPVRDLPRCEHSSFNRPVVVLLEQSEALYPIWPDMHAAWLTLSRLLGKRASRGFTLPNGPLSQWRSLHRRGSGSYSDIPAASQVILVGSFGAVADEHHAEINLEWHQLIRQLDKDGHQVALISARHLRQPPCPTYALEPTEASASAPPIDKACDALMAAIARHCLPNRQQLRHLRKALPGAGVEAELAVWQHTQTLCLDGYLQIVDSATSHWRSRWPEVFTSALEQALLDCRLSQEGAARDMSALSHALEKAPQASQFPALQRIGKRVKQRRAEGRHNSHVQFLLRNFLPGLRELADTQPEPNWQPLMAEAQRVAMQANEALPLKEQGLEEVAGRYFLIQQRQQLRLVSETEINQPTLLELNSQPFCQQTRSLLPTLSPQAYNELALTDRDHNYRLKVLRRPNWAERIWRNREGLFAAHAEGAVFHLQEAGPECPQSRWQLLENPWPWANEVGVDDHGLWAGFTIGKAHQRMRWIPPGVFVMGSPYDEDERNDNEIQHQVTLTKGYWLGETSCIQALWQAVMGENPSDNKGDDLPVETVSWNDCQRFIERLAERLPDFKPSLPTEAQWEYACRAGSKTAYWWGEKMDNKYANNGRQTENETQYPANDFGLRSMSGNVYEWCSDWSGGYPAEPVIDPAGAEEGRGRVLRGGGWILLGRYLRSAYRITFSPDSRYHSFGVRLAGGCDPQASQGARAMSADRWERSDRRSGDQGAGEGPATGEHQ